MTTAILDSNSTAGTAALDDVHGGDIRGALGTIRGGDTAVRANWRARLATLLAIIGPGLIVMVGDNDAGAFGTYTQAGQNYGTALAWTLLCLIPVLYVNQEMVVRLGVVTRVGHARLILQRFGRFWGAFSVIDLFLLNALTIVTEFIGVSLALGYLGMPRDLGVVGAAAIIVAAAGTGDFRRFEQVSLLLVSGSALLLPVLLWVHPAMGPVAHALLTPRLPAHARLSDVMLLIIAIVGTTVAPWQLFFQQSYIIDKRITQRFVRYARVDLWIGIAVVVLGAVAMMAFTAKVFAGHSGFGHFTDAGAVAAGIGRYAGRAAGVCFALALIDASIIGAMAVSLSTAYAIGDMLALNHSLNRKPQDAKTFYAVYVGLIAISAALVLAPGTPLGLITNAVQTLAGILLPSATVFLLLLCNDREVLGPHVNGPIRNLITGAIIAVLVVLSLILTTAMIVPQLPTAVMIWMLALGAILGAVTGTIYLLPRRRAQPPERELAAGEWRMPPLAALAPARVTPATRWWMIVLRGYLIVAGGLVLARIVALALTGQSGWA